MWCNKKYLGWYCQLKKREKEGGRFILKQINSKGRIKLALIMFLIFFLIVISVFAENEDRGITQNMPSQKNLAKAQGGYLNQDTIYGTDDFVQFQYKITKPSSPQCSPVKQEKDSEQKKAGKAFKKQKPELERNPPEAINQEEIESERFLEILEEDSEFKKTYEYAKKLGYTKLNNSIKTIYDDGKIITVSTLLSNDQKGVFLINLEGNLSDEGPKITSYLSKLREENDTVILTMFGEEMFGEEWGVELDLINRMMVSEWGHHSCSFGSCVGYCFEWWLEISWIGSLCKDVCYEGPYSCVFNLISTGMSPFAIPECAICVSCMAAAGVGCLGTCAIEPCGWYPCLEDCNDQDGYYGSSWEYYCDGANRMKHRLYYDYNCSSSTPQEGSCVSDSYYVDETCDTCPCPYGCNEVTDNCKGAVTCYDDGDCGDTGWVGSPSCSGGDVYQNLRTYTCHNKGTENSYCSYSDSYTLKQVCSSGDCESGECQASSSCENPDYPWFCNEDCYSCPEDSSLCCPDSGQAEWCCYDTGLSCDTSTGECTVCAGDYPLECNGGCYGCPYGGDFCCPTSGPAQWCCAPEVGSVCMSDGSCCIPHNETCDNYDNDCDTIIDSFNEGCGLGACANGTRTCTAGSWGSCSTAGLATSETCNDVDDNCDGSVDESLSQECGTDEGVCVKGTQTCSAGNWSSCGGSYVGPADEICNGIDDNCNNVTDEQNVCNDSIIINLEFPENNAVENNTSYPTFGFNITNVVYTSFDCDLWLDNGTQSIYGNRTIWINVEDSWNLTANETVPEGMYDWWINCSDGVNTNISEKRAITVGDPPTNSIILYPNGGETIDDSTIINWTESVDAEDFVTYFLQYSNNSGTSWYDTVLNYGYENKLSDSSTEKNVTFSGNENQTIYLRLPKNAEVLNARLDITGLE